MMRATWMAMLPLILVGCGGEERVERPRLCLLAALPSDVPQAIDKCRENPQKTVTAEQFEDGQTLYVLHTLSEKASVDAPVSVTVESACPGSARESERFHQNNSLLFPVIAPPGASCSLSVTATILNETAHIISASGATDCKPKCAETDAGSQGEEKGP